MVGDLAALSLTSPGALIVDDSLFGRLIPARLIRERFHRVARPRRGVAWATSSP
jgi:hypothetical protein